MLLVRFSGIAVSVVSTLFIFHSATAAHADSQKTLITYSLGGLVNITATENAASKMQSGLWGSVQVGRDGEITGRGIIRYERAEPCQWTPPEPENGDAPHCRIDELVDGSFSISGSVIEYVHRHDDDNPLKDAAFDLADKFSSERLGYIPLRMKLELTMIKQPRELLSLWGFSTPNIEERYTGAAMIGLHSSTLFNGAFEISPIAVNYKADSNSAITTSHVHQFHGSYKGGTPVTANGNVFFIARAPNQLPTKTDPMMYWVHEDKSPKPRAFTDTEIRAMEAYEQNGTQQPSRFYERDLAEQAIKVLNGL